MAENEADTIAGPVPDRTVAPTPAPGSGWASAAPGTVPPAGGTEPGVQYGPVLGADPAPVDRSRGLRERLRQPAVAAVMGGVLLLGVGFGTGYVVGRDQGESTGTSQPDGPGGFGGVPGGGRGFGPGQTGQGLTGQGQTGQGQTPPGTDGSADTSGTTGSTT